MELGDILGYVIGICDTDYTGVCSTASVFDK